MCWECGVVWKYMQMMSRSKDGDFFHWNESRTDAVLFSLFLLPLAPGGFNCHSGPFMILLLLDSSCFFTCFRWDVLCCWSTASKDSHRPELFVGLNCWEHSVLLKGDKHRLYLRLAANKGQDFENVRAWVASMKWVGLRFTKSCTLPH